MRPDDRRRRSRPFQTGGGQLPRGTRAVPRAHANAAIEAELATAGARIRAERSATGVDLPDPAFAVSLRSRLIGGDTVADAPLVSTSVDPTTVVVRAMRRFPPRTIALWTLPAMAAVLVAALIASTSGPVVPATVGARATEVDDATLVRGGTTTTLVAGTALLAGDEIRVGATGRTTLELGGSRARLDGGADLRLDSLASDRLRLELLAGRSYHRVGLAAGGTYVVATGSVTWTARGTSFDLDREPIGGDSDRITLLGLEHSVEVTGPNGTTVVGQGQAASLTVEGGTVSELVVSPIDPVALADPWLVANARSDRALGFPLGVLEVPDVGPAPTSGASLTPPDPTSTADPTATGGSTPAPTVTPGASPGSGPTARATSAPTPGPDSTSTPRPDPTPKPTAGPTSTPAPTPTPDFHLRVTSCDGGVVMAWSRYRGSSFDRYVTLRSSSAAIPRAYPPHAGTAVVDGSALSDRSRTGTVDTSGTDGSTSFYRTVVLDVDDTILAASPVEAAVAKGIRQLGPLDVGPADASRTAFDWSEYDGFRGCFTRYALVWSNDDPTPSALTGADVAYVSSDRTSSTALVDLAPGTYHLRLEVLRSIGPGSSATFVVAHSDVATYTVP
jgi:FecR protein